MKIINGKKYLNTAETAAFLNVSQPTARRMIREHNLQHLQFKKHGKLWVSEDDLKALIASSVRKK